MRMIIQKLVPAIVIAGGVLVVQPGLAVAAPTVTFLGGSLAVFVSPTSNLAIGCTAGGQVTVNGTTASPAVPCAAVTEIRAKVRTSTTPVANVVDMRGVTPAAFPSVTWTEIISRNGKDTVYGTAGPDVIYASGSVTAGDGSDNIYSTDSTVSSVLRGGAGNDYINGADGARDTLEGGAGDDEMFGGRVGTDTLLGGDGNDSLNVSGTNSRYEGGKGDDSFGIWLVGEGTYGNGATLYGGAGTDTLRDSAGDACGSVAAPGGIGSVITLSCPGGWAITVSTSGVEVNLFQV
jgi:Ca2+-binding RTX toxin-like protein